MVGMRRRKGAVVLLGAVCLVAAVLVWHFGLSRGPARKLVGTWEVGETEFEDTMKEAIKKKDPEAASRVGDIFRSTERIHFDRNGNFRHDQDLLGLTLTSEGTWEATETNEGTLSVTLHVKKSSVRDPKGQTREESKDVVIAWVVSVVDHERLSATMTSDDGKRQKFPLRRARD